MKFQVRPALISDAHEIARLSGVLGYSASSEEFAERLNLLLPNPSHLVLVAEAQEGNSLLAWVAAERRMILESGLKFEIVGLVVDEMARRSGVGRALVHATEQWVLDQSGEDIVVRSNVLRHESHGFYESLGYIRKKSQHVYNKRLPA